MLMLGMHEHAIQILLTTRQSSLSYLQTEPVEEIVDEVFGTAQQALVQVLAGGILEDRLGDRRHQLVLLSVIFLPPVHNGLKDQQQEHLQMVLERDQPINISSPFPIAGGHYS